MPPYKVKEKLAGIGDVFKNKQMMVNSSVKHILKMHQEVHEVDIERHISTLTEAEALALWKSDFIQWTWYGSQREQL